MNVLRSSFQFLPRHLTLASLCLGCVLSLPAQQPTGSIEGRVSNPATGAILEHARLTIEGSTLETFTDSDGNYRLTQVPAGTVRVKAFFTGFPPASATVSVAA